MRCTGDRERHDGLEISKRRDRGPQPRGMDMNTLMRRERGRLTRLGGLVVLTALLILAPTATVAVECQTPLFVQTGAVDANVMILFDSSGSMNAAIYHEGFDPNVTYSGRFTTSRTYYISSDGSYRPRSFSWSWETEPYAYLVNSDGAKGEYLGNYLNWVFYHASEVQRGEIPQTTRVQVAKMVVQDIIQNSSRVRFGLARFNSTSGARILAECGATQEELVDAVQGIVASSYTPLAESMKDIADYFKSSGGPIEVECQHNFLIVMTDGFPTKDLDNGLSLIGDQDGDGNEPGTCNSIGAWFYPESYDCSDYMDDVAWYMRHNDLRTDLGDPGESWEEGQNVITYTIGFGIDAGILQDTAENGDGLYLLANDAVELWHSLETILQEIIVRISSGAAVAVVSTERGDDDRLFRGKFMPGTWQGYLECFQLPYEMGDHSIWEAGTILRNSNLSERNIYTSIGGERMVFDQSNASELMAAMGCDTHEEAADLIDWTRGERVEGLRERNGWVLGDVIHSTPVVVGPPRAFTTDPDYQVFLDGHSERQKVVMVGGNDGMLHAFHADYGTELWAYIPEYALAQLKDIAAPSYCHKYSVDLPPAITDAYIDGHWKTILACGGREGSDSYFVLDVTYPQNIPGVEFEVSLTDGNVYPSEIEFATIDGTPMMLVGSGLNETTGQAWLYGYNLDTGQLEGRKELSNLGAGNRNKATKPRALDYDLDGNTDVVYIGDMDGTMWRLNVEDQVDPFRWDEYELFVGNEPITAAPAVAFGNEGSVMIYFGTGSYLDVDDVVNQDTQYFYCVKDDNSRSTHDRGDLVDQTHGEREISAEEPGWWLRLQQGEGERVTEPAVVVAGTVFFTSYAPSCEPCQSGGSSWLYRLAWDDGGNQEDMEGEETGEPRVEHLGDGIASRSVVDLVNETIIVQSSDATISVEDLGNTIFRLTVRSWQENYDGAYSYGYPSEVTGDQ